MALALVALLVGAAAPALGSLLGRRSLDAAAATLAGEIARIRHEAIAKSRHVGLAFESGSGNDGWAVYLDGGGAPGIRALDIAAGNDVRTRGPLRMGTEFDGVRFGIPSKVPRIPPARGHLSAGDDPVQLGGTDILSFSPTGESTSGSLYLTDRRGGLRAVVVYGRTGRVRRWRWVPEAKAWRQ